MAEAGRVRLRGSFGFEVTPDGDLLNDARNVERLRRLWLDPDLLVGNDLGPGDRGDFDHGAWHVSCHLLGAGGVRRSADGELQWLEVSHDGARDEYFASVTVKEGGRAVTHRLDSAPGREAIEGSALLGFVEGNSTGRISARGVQDAPAAFNLWRRQDFDRPAGSKEDGGKVWEHWCTTRDIRTGSRAGTSVLTAYVSLVAALGDRFPASVARGRTVYGHPRQLAAMVRAGFVGRASALWSGAPEALPARAATLLDEADPRAALEAAEILAWSNVPKYYMYRRRMGRWCGLSVIRKAIEGLDAGNGGR